MSPRGSTYEGTSGAKEQGNPTRDMVERLLILFLGIRSADIMNRWILILENSADEEIENHHIDRGLYEENKEIKGI
jgi:hypothetical protein